MINEQNNDNLNVNGFSHSSREIPFGFPLNYFDSLEGIIVNKIELEDELKEFQLLSSISKQNYFTTPEAYFIKSEDKLFSRAELAEYSVLNSIDKKLVVINEEHYFETLSKKLSCNMELRGELDDLKVLNAITKVNSYDVPDNYFEDFSFCLKTKIFYTKEKQEFSLTNLFGFIFSPKIAFSFGLSVFLVLLSIIYFNSNKSNGTIEDCNTLACLEKQEILKNNEIEALEEEQLIDLVNLNSLNNQLNLKGNTKDSLHQEEFLFNNVNTEQLIEEL